MITDYFFWFAQPSTYLDKWDFIFGYFFAALFVIGLVLLIAKRFTKHEIVKKLLGRFASEELSMGLIGLIWFGLRYENTPIFGKRLWAGLIVLVMLVWAFFVFKYLLLRFRAEKKEYDDFQMKSKYLPGKK
ncbi:MAG: hypothetical protein A3H72_00075 [Candidatus Doudnabacteria bacterium RIFCSPLOWO2_02_FULL_48_8]|uniref:Uncharacterized protein n=1 Tax=Candidatus Doudnabacteria bacterium RIFCSPHIGHO2_01_FULL_46_24 TaxID=1817825 RepID=A0A1F5NW09_9BACT|nr:MAG: hypothetical protein A2720_03535 [Candidatus Doudnabacteria bacterium RIFCSPHIGHO2_01_FULL_46_24]OGE95140.1 MAG: hypothetical protein A3H72_00075 [Candidatus Doudnabacteria bacterium RIFCSPLOWO2_02_FULL_48_8]OGE95639.1 MAG: hypothetical protein A3E98_01175 [Candidatus Doudnabacteria bacterium RIFCSPHIGHO2_12_FULL_48_11]